MRKIAVIICVTIFLILLNMPLALATQQGKPEDVEVGDDTTLTFITDQRQTGCPIQWHVRDPGGDWMDGEEDTLKCCYVGARYDTATYDFPEKGRWTVKVTYESAPGCATGSYSWYVDATECSLSTPENCPHVGEVCLDNDFFCGDTFIYNNYYYCDIDEVYCDLGCENDACVECESHDYKDCDNNDVYWYNSCDEREDKYDECGSDSCDGWGGNYCKDNDVYHSKTCYDRGCSSDSCFSNPTVTEEKVLECGTNGCANNACKLCSLSNPELCPHYGKMCMTASVLCNDAFQYNGGYYCEDFNEVTCANGCANNACITCTAGWKCQDSTTRAYQNADCSWTTPQTCEKCFGAAVCGNFQTSPSTANQNADTTLRVLTINNFINSGCPVDWSLTDPDGIDITGESDTLECCAVGAYFDESTYDFPKFGTYTIFADFPVSGPNCPGQFTAEWDVVSTCTPSCQYSDVCDESASNGCGSTCTRDTDGNTCAAYSVCNSGQCELQPWCGDGTCNGDETPSTCVEDCTWCGDGTCNGDETPSTCQEDCAECTSGTCCDTSSGTFQSSSFICDYSYGNWEYGCPWGENSGDDAGKRIKKKYCSGSSASCSGATSWKSWAVYDACDDDEHCGSGSCISNVETNCNLPNGVYNKCSEECPCSEGQGDCDDDFDCKAGLTCAENAGPQYGFSEDVDICLSETDVPFDDMDFCTPANPCSNGEGDCDTDNDCVEGSVCQYDYGEFYGLAGWVDVCETQDYGCHVGVPGDSGYCTATCPCTAGEGTCISDYQCQNGLICSNQSSTNYGYQNDEKICDILGGSDPMPRDAFTVTYEGETQGSPSVQDFSLYLDGTASSSSLGGVFIIPGEFVKIPITENIQIVGMAHIIPKTDERGIEVTKQHPCVKNKILTAAELAEFIPHFNIAIHDSSLPRGKKELLNVHILFTKRYKKSCPVVYEKNKFNFCIKTCEKPEDIIKNPPLPIEYPQIVTSSMIQAIIEGLGFTSIQPWGPFEMFDYPDSTPWMLPTISTATAILVVVVIGKIVIFLTTGVALI